MNSQPPRPWFLYVLRVCLVIQLLPVASAAYGVYLGEGWSFLMLSSLIYLLLIWLLLREGRSYRQRRRNHFAHHSASPSPTG
jgi:hypothetical protein